MLLAFQFFTLQLLIVRTFDKLGLYLKLYMPLFNPIIYALFISHFEVLFNSAYKFDFMVSIVPNQFHQLRILGFWELEFADAELEMHLLLPNLVASNHQAIIQTRIF